MMMFTRGTNSVECLTAFVSRTKRVEELYANVFTFYERKRKISSMFQCFVVALKTLRNIEICLSSKELAQIVEMVPDH